MSTGRPKLGAVFRGDIVPDRAAGLAGLLSVAAQPPTKAPEAEKGDAESAAAESGDPSKSPATPRAAVGERALSLTPPPRPEQSAAPTADQPSSRPKAKRATSVAPTAPQPDPSSAMKMVPVNIDVSLHPELKQFATRAELSFGTIALRAVEANVDELSAMWQPRAAVKTGLFGSAHQPATNRRVEPAVQIQLRMPIADAEVLDGLVAAWLAPSRSALINEALRLYVTTSGSAR